MKMFVDCEFNYIVCMFCQTYQLKEIESNDKMSKDIFEMTQKILTDYWSPQELKELKEYFG